MDAQSVGRLVGLVILIGVTVFVYSDAKKRGMNAILWAIGTFLLCIVILPIYLIIRKPVGYVPPAPGMPPPPMPLPPTYQQPPQQGYQQPPQAYQPPSQSAPPPYAPPSQPSFQPPQTPPAPPAGTAPPAPKQGKFCPSCGAPHEGTVRFCPNCGAAL